MLEPSDKTSRSVSEITCLNFAPLHIPCPSPQNPCSIADPGPGLADTIHSQWTSRSPSLESCPTSREIYLWCFFKIVKSRDSASTVLNDEIIKIYEYSCSKKAVKLSVRDDKALGAGHLAEHPQWTPGSLFSPAAWLQPVQQCRSTWTSVSLGVFRTTVTSKGKKPHKPQESTSSQKHSGFPHKRTAGVRVSPRDLTLTTKPRKRKCL